MKFTQGEVAFYLNKKAISNKLSTAITKCRPLVSSFRVRKEVDLGNLSPVKKP